MGAAYDFMCENEGLENKISRLQRKNREIKKELLELAEGIQGRIYSDEALHKRAQTLIEKYNKPKKKK